MSYFDAQRNTDVAKEFRLVGPPLQYAFLGVNGYLLAVIAIREPWLGQAAKFRPIEDKD